jgi:hypothetical protein
VNFFESKCQIYPTAFYNIISHLTKCGGDGDWGNVRFPNKFLLNLTLSGSAGGLLDLIWFPHHTRAPVGGGGWC